MSWINGNALAVMLRPMFPSIFARVDELEADGTLDKTSDLLKTLSTNGTFDALKELAVKIDRHNELLERIAQNGNFVFSKGESQDANLDRIATEASDGRRNLLEPNAGSDAGGPVDILGDGMSGTDGPD